MVRETLEATKRRLGLNKPAGDGQPGDKPRDRVKELEDEIAQEEDYEKRRALSLKLKEQRLEHELRVRDLQAQLRGTREGGNVAENGGATQEQKDHEQKALQQRERVMTQAKALLDSGVEPQQVGALLLGLPAVGAASGQGMTVADSLKIVDMIVERKKEGELRGTIERLEKQVENLTQEIRAGPSRAQGPANPAEGIKQQAQAFKGLIDALKEIGVPIGESGGGGAGESVEQMREKHRHEEKMEELHTERTYKESIATALGDVVERVGRGAAHQFLEQGGTEEPAGAKLDDFTCTEKDKDGLQCGTRIQIPPGATKFTCPKCLSIYGPKEK